VFDTVTLAGVRQPHLDLCHPGVVRAIIDADPAAPAQAAQIHTLLRDKDVPGLLELGRRTDGPRADTLQTLCVLTGLYGDISTLARARCELPPLPGITQALDALDTLLRALPELHASIDLADVRGYGYHSGVTFSLYAEGWHDALVSGGRYDDVSRVFGRARPATGFSLDLRKLAAGLSPAEPSRAVRAPWSQDPALVAAVRSLRHTGEIVVQVLPGHDHDQDEFICDRELSVQDGAWKVCNL
jgi:ATP phosphoribosyltransferase regulatory subunit